ncbi:MAG TPA: peptidylprolyl isomerase [Tepidisphaeraceae bacterium]|nr:peptidylprolyl isomerase [Tepidisphaeraceae bacterium]
MALVINGQRIEDSILYSEFSEIKTYFERLGNVSCCERDGEFRGYARENVISRVLLAQEAKRRLPPMPQADVDGAVAKLIEQYGGESGFFTMTGASTEQMHLVRHDVEADLRVRKMMDDLSADLHPADADLRQFYEQNLDRFMTEEQVRASHILKAPTRGEQRNAVYEELRQVRKQLQAGADFDELARKHSDKADEHIDLNFFKRGELAEEFEMVAFSMEAGELSPVFVSPFGFHLIKLTDRKPATPKPFEEIGPEVRQQYVETKRQERARKLVEELKAHATIEEVADAVNAPELSPAWTPNS